MTIEITKSIEAIDTKLTNMGKEFINKSELDTQMSDLNAKVAASTATLTDTQTKSHADLTEKFEKMEANISAILPTADAVKSDTLVIKFGDDPKRDFTKSFDIMDGGDLVTKAVDSNINTPGSPSNSLTPFYKLQAGNPLRTYGSVFPVGSGQSINIPQVSGINWVEESVVTPGRTDASALTNKLVSVANFVVAPAIARAALDGLPGLDQAMVGFIAARAPIVEVKDTLAVIKAATAANGEISNIVSTSNGAAALPAEDKIIGKMSDMIAITDSGYAANGTFLVSRRLMSAIQSSNNNGLNFNPANGVATLFGYPIVIVDNMEAGNAAGNMSAIFGDIRMGVVTVTKQSMDILRSVENQLGKIVYHSTMSSKGAVWDGSALTALITKA